MRDNINVVETDHLREMFESFFKFSKHPENQPEPEYIRDALNGALSGLDYGFSREEYLQKLSKALECMLTVTEIELNQRNVFNKQYRDGQEYKEELSKTPKNTLKLDEVVKRFGIAKNSLKDKEWRDKNGFPYQQLVDGGKVTYYADAIEKWLANQSRMKTA